MSVSIVSLPASPSFPTIFLIAHFPLHPCYSSKTQTRTQLKSKQLGCCFQVWWCCDARGSGELWVCGGGVTQRRDPTLWMDLICVFDIWVLRSGDACGGRELWVCGGGMWCSGGSELWIYGGLVKRGNESYVFEEGKKNERERGGEHMLMKSNWWDKA